MSASPSSPPPPSAPASPNGDGASSPLRRYQYRPGRRLYWSGALLGVLLLGWGVSTLWRDWQAPLPVRQPMVWELSEGSSLQALMRDLEAAGYRTPPGLYIYARVRGWDRKLKSGEYRLMPGDSYYDLLRKMVQGWVHMHRITFIEGWTLGRALQEMHLRTETITPSLRDLPPSEVIGNLRPHAWHCPKDTGGLALYKKGSVAPTNAEGLFFPDTYMYKKNTEDMALLIKAYREMCRHLSTLWRDRSSQLPYDSPYEVLIMASILEKEARYREEMTRMAGVFVRRLERNMRLEADPTVTYGLGEDFEGPLLFSHLRRPSPYNTYLNRGLPPTPIAMPGRHSIYAALHPRQEEAVYFVRTPDHSGAHVFSATLEEHRAAVQEWRRWKRSQAAAEQNAEQKNGDSS